MYECRRYYSLQDCIPLLEEATNLLSQITAFQNVTATADQMSKQQVVWVSLALVW